MSKNLNAPIQFSTARLHLRKPKLEDARLLFQTYTTDHEVVRYLTWQAHETEGDTLDYLQQCLEAWSNGTNYPYVIELSEDTVGPIGMIDLRPQYQRVEFGYVLAREHWWQGYMTEALSALVDWSLDQPDVWRASAFCDVDNPASEKVMQKAGMAFEGILRRYFVHPNVSSEPRDCRMYAKVRP